jgi:60 kDa SS-A/Ro ribonucleoprotein
MSQLQEYADFLNGKTVTYEGGAAWKMSLEERVAEFFSLGLLNGMYYQSQEEALQDAAGLFAEALSDCPEFATKAALYGHEVNSLKLAPLLWAAYLSTLPDKTLFIRAFPRLANNIKLLHDFVKICRKTPIRKGLGRSVKRAVNEQLRRLVNPYSVTRYKNAVKEIARVTRPLFRDEAFQNLMRYAAKDKLGFERAVELKRVLEKIGRNEIDGDVLTSIEKYNFQLEELKHAVNNFSAGAQAKLERLAGELVRETNPGKTAALEAQIHSLKEKQAGVLGAEGKRALYGALYRGLRYNALILNLAALERVFAVETRTVHKRGVRGSFVQEETLRTEIPGDIEEMVCGKIRSLAAYRASGMLPFALISAQRMVKNGAFRTALGEALEAAAAETFAVPEGTNILVGADISGSMDCMVNDSLSARDISALFGALLKKSGAAVRVCGISDDCWPVTFRREDLFGMAEEISGSGEHGGTRLGSLMKQYRGEKIVIILTDSETADDFEVEWKKKSPRARLIVWQLQPYHIKISHDPSVLYIAGFSDKLLTLVKKIIEDKGTMIDEIKGMTL